MKVAPIQTQEHMCRDCYKCLRECPVKAISFQDGRARVQAERCVWCGKCVNVCPVGAKQSRSEKGTLALLLNSEDPVVVSLAPSFAGEFPGVSSHQMISGLKALGFDMVSETAIGAEFVSNEALNLLTKNDSNTTESANVVISSACPAVVEFCNKYKEDFPGIEKFVTPLFSPLLAHCALIREQLPQKHHIVFIGPCIAKKQEADAHPELLDCVLTFEDLRDLFEEKGIDLQNYPAQPEDPEMIERFFLGKAGKGSLYPYEGGMIESMDSMKKNTNNISYLSMSFSGLASIEWALQEIPDQVKDQKLFLELLACKGGCVNGPMSHCQGKTISKRLAVMASQGDEFKLFSHSKNFDDSWDIKPALAREFDRDRIAQALRRIGKSTLEDELNCGGCGYNNCRDFARAFLEGKAEETMCVSYMRSLAQEKANALIEKMPSGAIIVDDRLSVIECNHNFAALMGGEVEQVWESQPRLTGAKLEKLVDFAEVFRRVLDTGIDIHNQKIKHDNKVLAANIFVIQKNHVVGGIFYDITQSWVNRDRIIRNAKQMIAGNLETVQQIAYLLGENAAENEVTLNSIIESFSTGTGVDDRGFGDG